MRACIILLLIPLAEAQGEARLIYTTDRPGNQIIYGCAIRYSIEGFSGYPRSFKWEYRSTTGTCGTTFGAMTERNTGPSQWVSEFYPGSFQIRCTITYGPSPVTGITPKPEYPKLDITIPPPDGVRIAAGDGVSVPIGEDIDVIFAITCKDEDVCDAIGLAQERISNVRDYKGRIIPFEYVWGPLSPHPRFYLSGNAIVDIKGYTPKPLWFDLPLVTFETATQELRLVITDPCGNQTAYPLGTFTVKWVKDSKTTYRLEHTQ
jgi:hypothetical protein